MTDRDDQAQPPAEIENRIEVTLKKEHSHRGEEKKPGDKIRVTPRQRQWLKEIGVI